MKDSVPTQLLDLPKLAERAGIARVLVKCENERPYGNFKILGGMRAGLNALAAAANLTVEALVKTRPKNLPRLLTASAGNHGLAVAVAAQRAGSNATIFLSEHANKLRARRIEELGADIVWVRGTYDDACAQAESLVKAGGGILISDTSAKPSNAIVQDVMAGYTQIADEIVAQLPAAGIRHVDRVFVQAGVGGLAAAMAEGLQPVMTPSSTFYAVEPESVACVAAALRAKRLVQISGEQQTQAEMLSCGVASAPALDILLHRHAQSVTVSEAQLKDAVEQLHKTGGPNTTPSGATGLAGLLATTMKPTDTALIFVTEASLEH